MSTNLTDPELRKRYSITSEELIEWIKKVPALKQVMVLDTCAAGAAVEKLTAMRSPMSASQIRAIERLKDRTGFHVLMGSAADAVSYEASQYGQGLLTYSLLEGMRGASLRENEYVDVSKLFQYATDRVPKLAHDIGGIQQPRVSAPRGTSFDIGQLTDVEKRGIPIAMVKPMILRPMLMNQELGYDDLELTLALRKGIREKSYSTARGGRDESVVVFVDADELPGAIRPSGIYTVEGDIVKVNLNLIRDGQRLSGFEAVGDKNSKEELVSEIMDSIKVKVEETSK